jgi:hypothetical protein
MRTALIAGLLLSLSLSVSGADRTQDILGAFTKYKHVNKQKRGVTKARFAQRHGEAAGAQSGTYAVDGLDFSLQLTVGADGAVRGSGNDRARTFTLRNARVAGALLTATKVYADGTTSALEGVFMVLVSRNGTTPEDAVTTHTYGLGVLPETPVDLDGMQLEKLFYERGSVPRS